MTTRATSLLAPEVLARVPRPDPAPVWACVGTALAGIFILLVIVFPGLG